MFIKFQEIILTFIGSFISKQILSVYQILYVLAPKFMEEMFFRLEWG